MMLRAWKTTHAAILALSGLLPVMATGCGNGVTASPSKEAARSALETALKTWQEGGKPGALDGTDPRIQIHDTPWSRGDLLESYEILSEDSGEAERRFAVRLSLAKPKQTEEVKYHVLGLDPVMIFRDEDYDRNINMLNGPSTTKSGQRKGARPPQ